MTEGNKDTKVKEDLTEEKESQYVENEEWQVDEEKLEEVTIWEDSEIARLKELVSKLQADYDNFQKRTERDKQDMIFFLKKDIFKKILSRLDDLERMVKNTPEDMRVWVLYEWVVTLEKTLKKDLETMWVKAFDSIWQEVNADKHDVMTAIPWKEKDIICDEFEKWYMLWDKVLRHAKVVVGSGQ